MGRLPLTTHLKRNGLSTMLMHMYSVNNSTSFGKLWSPSSITLPIHIRRNSCVSRSLLFWHSHRIYWEPIVQAMYLLWNYILVRFSCDNSKKFSIKNCYSLDMSPITLLYLLYLITWLSVLDFWGSVELNSLLVAKNVPAFDYC